ncbi:hypothetical protein B0H14DRAFT_3905754 [Mycena olivaceomarginata]|nr:hypothetical protein B0H14DRAFT_3905754 [Mycena olivaceomarginata]
MTLTLPPPLRRSARTRQTPNAPPEQEVPAPETTKPAPLRKRKQIETEGNNGGAHEPKRVKKRSANMAADARAIATASKNIPQNEKDLGVNTSSTEEQAVRQGSSQSNPSLSEQPPPPPPLADQDLSTQGLHWSDAPHSFGLIGTSGEFRGTAGSSLSLSSPPSPQTTSTMKTQSPPDFPRALTGTSPHASLSTVQDAPPAVSATQDLPPVALSALQDAPPAESLLAHSISAIPDFPPAALSAIQDVGTLAVQDVPVMQDLLPATPSAMQEAPPAESPLAHSVSAIQDLAPASIFVMQDVHTSVVQDVPLAQSPSLCTSLSGVQDVRYPAPHRTSLSPVQDAHDSPHAPPHASPSTMPHLVELLLSALPLADIVPSRRASPSTQESQHPALSLHTVISSHTTSSKSLPRLDLSLFQNSRPAAKGTKLRRKQPHPSPRRRSPTPHLTIEDSNDATTLILDENNATAHSLDDILDRHFEDTRTEDEDKDEVEAWRSVRASDEEVQWQGAHAEDFDGSGSDYEEAARAEDRRFQKDRSTFLSKSHLTTQEEEDEADERDFENEFGRQPRRHRVLGDDDEHAPPLRRVPLPPKPRRKTPQRLVDSDDDDEPVSLPKPALLSPKLRRKTPQRLVDSDDDDDPSPQPKPKARLGVRQQKQTDVDGDGEGSDIEHENTDADTEGYSYKSGPVPQGAKDRLLKAQDDLAQIVEQMAVELNKPAHLLWQVIDAQPKGVRSPTAWNMFQTWLYAPTGGAQKHEKHLSKTEQAELDRAQYGSYLDELDISMDDRKKSKKVLEKMTWLTTWHTDFQEEVRASRTPAACARQVASISRDLTKISESAYRDGGFHVFGFVINTDGGSTSFGATTAYKLLRQRQAGVWKSTTREYESRLHVLQMELDGLNASEVVKSQRTRDLERVRPRVTEDGDVEGDRDSTRKFIKDCLVKDLLDILVVRNQLTVQDATSSSQTMKWTAWADYAYENQLRLENWDDDMASNGKYPKKGFNINFFQERENERVVPALDARHFPEDYNVDREELAEKAMRIVSWTEDEMAVSLEKQGDVPIIQTVSGVTVASVSSAGKWEKAVKGKHEKAEKERKKKAKGKGKEKEVVVRQTKKASTHVRARSRSRGTASDTLKDHRRPVTHDSGAESDNDDPRLKEHGRRVAVHTAPGPSHRRSSSGTAPAPGPSSSARTPPTANTRTMSKRERKELLEWLQREKDADAAEEANISRIKFRLQYYQEQSPLFYGEIQVLGAGESQTEGEKHMIYWDKNFNQWRMFPANFGCVLEGEQEAIYLKYLKRWNLD